MKSYCVRNKQDCETCSLSNYGRDCQGAPHKVEMKVQVRQFDLWKVLVNGELWQGDLTRGEARALKAQLERPLAESLEELMLLGY